MNLALILLVMAPVRPNLPDQGYGWVINDLERHAHAGHPMRNERDPGNWAHELTHQINSDLRTATPEADNAFYFLKGQYVRLSNPNTTLAQVAAEVPKDQQGAFYHLYLIEQQRWWGDEALYILDEASAYANGLMYHATTGTKDASRLQGAKEFVNYVKAVVRAVEKNDPNYQDLDKLRKFSKWYENRINETIKLYNTPDYNVK